MKTKMNTLKNTVLPLLLIGAIALTSCSKKGCTDPTATNFDDKAKKEDNSCTYDNDADTVLSGSIQESRSLDASKTYTLSGGVHVKSGAVLSIPAGTVIQSDPTESVAYLLIERGARIEAIGTSDAPIVFTSGSANPASGDWGGIIICGKAPINNGSEATAEVGDVLYGGTNSADNSGTLQYVRVEYSGNAINDEKEHNGFTFNGVGSGTTLAYLQSYMGNDDGFEFFGGSVDANHLISTGSGDDGFDWTYGWVGSGSYWIAEQVDGIGDRGIEADNNGDDNTAAPFSNPTLSNLTLSGYGSGDGIKLREGTKANISNALITNFSDGLDVEHSSTVTHIVSGELLLSNITLAGVADLFEISGFETSADSANAADKINAALTNAASGAGSNWRTSWSKSL
ncbi:MAG: hypothetical protein RLP15_07545 [Cryomorphaceae bacterium]